MDSIVYQIGPDLVKFSYESRNRRQVIKKLFLYFNILFAELESQKCQRIFDILM
jgi:hypothetical protein